MMVATDWDALPNPKDPQREQHSNANHIDRLLDAIELVKANQREKARSLLRSLIGENGDFEDAWLWMSVAVDSMDQAVVCLDNVLRINPNNIYAATALYRLRQAEFAGEQTRARLRAYRDLMLFALAMLTMGLLFAILLTSSATMWAAQM